MKITLPSFTNIEKYGKNHIYHQSINEIELDFTVTKVDKGTFHGYEIQSKESGIVLVISKKSSSKILDKYDMILLLEEGNFGDLFLISNKFKWHKHPLINKTPIFTKSYSITISNTWNNNFNIIQEDIKSGKKGFRLPQIGALYAILSHYTASNSVSTIVMPTGTGKTETMLGTLLSLKSKKSILVIVPSDALRLQISNKFITLGLFKELELITKDCKYPVVGVLKSKIKDLTELNIFLGKTNVVVTTMSILGGYDKDTQKSLSENFEYMFIDEAHHSKALTWSKFKDNFGNKNIIQFTATPFRNDKQSIGGKIIYNFSLKRAQDEGLFKHINFIPLYIYEKDKIDSAISEKAIEILEKDLANGYNHILMARCESVNDAEDVFNNYYSKYKKFNPVIIHTDSKRLSATEKNNNLQSLKELKSRIVVCVDMLGEGYDLPNLKIAALHYSHKSLGITLQFIGRFTRKDKDIGEATFITNIIDEKFKDGLHKLYSTDANWNNVISEMSGEKIKKETELREYIDNFGEYNIQDFSLPLDQLKVKYSSVFFQVKGLKWDEQKFISYIEGIFNKENIVYIFNNTDSTFVVIEKIDYVADFSDLKKLQGRNWLLHIVCYDEKNEMIYLQTSNKGLAEKMVFMMSEDRYKFMEQETVFRSFYGINALQLFIVGLYEGVGGKTKYRMHAGMDIAKELVEGGFTSQKIKSNIFASGFEKGMPISIGAAGKRGKIWSKFKGDICGWKDWCQNIAIKLKDDTINVDEILKGVLIPKEILELPNLYPINIEWPLDIYKDFNKYGIEIIDTGGQIGIENITIELLPVVKGILKFKIYSDGDFQTDFELIIKVDKNGISKYFFKKIDGDDIGIYKGQRDTIDILTFFNDYSPIIRYADGSTLEGNYFTEIKYDLINFDKDSIYVYDWTGINIKDEAQGIPPKPINTKSIQYKVIQDLKAKKYNIIFNDDGSGEIADIVAIEVDDKEQKINFELYHCKFSKESTPGARIGDFYEVCGQAQKSMRWADPKKVLEQIIYRGQKNINRFEKGSINDIQTILKKSEVYSHNIDIYIIQPGLSKEKISTSQEELLGVTTQYLKTTFNLDLYIIASK